MKTRPLTYEHVHAAATDAANRSMRKASRSAWSIDDYNAAVAEFERLWPSDQQEEACQN